MKQGAGMVNAGTKLFLFNSFFSPFMDASPRDGIIHIQDLSPQILPTVNVSPIS